MNISFVYPTFLFALSLISIPVIIHLFNFRRFKKVLFSNVRFLQELKQETSSRSRLKHLLVLASRILSVIFLVLAFAQPYIPASEGHTMAAQRVVSIFVDNSFSMETVTREGTLLDVARQNAIELARGFQPTDRFQVLTNDFEPAHQRLLSREEFITAVEGIKVSPVSRSTDEVLMRQRDAVSQAESSQKYALLLSDFQKSVTRFEQWNGDSTLQVALVPLQSARSNNLAVDSCWLSTPVVQLGQIAEVMVRIRNYGEMDVQAVPVKLTLNKIQKAVAGADIPAFNFTDVKLTFTASDTGWQRGVVSIIDNPITFDDTYFFSFHVSQSASILSINDGESGPYLKALFAPDGYFRLNQQDVRQIDFGSLRNYPAIFLNHITEIATGLQSELSRYIDAGGTLVIIPDSALSFTSMGEFMQNLGIAPFTSLVMNREKVTQLQLEDDIFEGVFSGKTGIRSDTDLPYADGYFVQSGNSALSSDVLMKLDGGAPMITRYRKGEGEVYLFSVPFRGNLSNFSRHALFVPVIYRIALLSEKGSKPAYTIGVDQHMEISATALAGDRVFHLINEELKFDAIPGHRTTGTSTLVTFGNHVIEAGNYELKSGSQTLAIVSFNYNRAESVMEFNTPDELNEMIDSGKLLNSRILEVNKLELAGGMGSVGKGTPLWKWCLLLTLIFLACEIILLKFWKS
jgi:hypothetical protein